jgi:hypothetical protein
VLVLLKQLQPYLSANNLSVAPPKQIRTIIPQRKVAFDPAGLDLAAGLPSTQVEVEALNRILNNINVQTKKNDTTDKLPPIKK